MPISLEPEYFFKAKQPFVIVLRNVSKIYFFGRVKKL